MRCSSVVGRRGNVASMTGPVGVDELARLSEELVSVSTKVVALSLDEVGGYTSRPSWEERERERDRAGGWAERERERERERKKERERG